MLEHLRTTVPSVLAEYHATHDLRDVPILVDHLRPMMEQRGFADRIVWEEYDFPAKNIAAMVSFYQAAMGTYIRIGDYARIQFSKYLNLCWQRFAVCKEMYHTILDAGQATRVTDMAGLHKLSESLVSYATTRMSDFPPYDTEGEAEILALETLFPLELRLHHKKAYDEGLVTDYQLALRYRIPEEYARMGMYVNYISSIERARMGTLVKL